MTNHVGATIYEFDNFRIDVEKRLLLNGDDEPIPLTPKIFDTLLYLVIHNGTIIEKEELMSAIWTDTIVEENNLNKNVSVLRRVLGENPGEHRFIATVPGTGYKFVADVREITNEKPPDTSSNALPHQENGRPGFRFVFAATALAVLIAAIVTGSFFWSSRNISVPANSLQTLAILPFRPLVTENRDEALELGMADTLISRLGNNREIVVRPLSSVRNFGKLEQDAIETGRSLDVASVLEGSIQRWGDKIRVNVRLIKVADGTMLWTDTFDEKFTDIFIVQDVISSRVATALALRLSGEEKTTVEKRFTNSAEAYAFYLRGRYHFFKITEPEIRTGIAFYEQAIQVDPNYALAYAGMADAYRTLAIAGFARSKEVCPQAKALAQRALAIDESLAEGHIVLGWIGFLYDWDWPSAEKELERAIELSPNNSEAHRAYAHLLSNAGRHDEAIAEGRRARELAPLTLITATLEGQVLACAGHDAEAIERLSQTLELDPDFWVAHHVLGGVYIRQGRFAEAITESQKAKELSSRSIAPLVQLGYIFAKSGDRARAMAVLQELESLSKDKNVPDDSALIYNGLGDTEKALEMLEKSREDREIQLAFLKVDTCWDNLRSEPRFIELMKQMNFGK